MGLKSIKILGISVTTNPKKEILEEVEKYLEETEKGKRKKEKGGAKPLVIVTPNPEQIVLAQKDKHFADVLNGADIAIPDGVGLALAQKILGFPHSPITHHSSPIRIPGVEFMEDLVGLAARRGYPIGLIGGRGGVADEALECLQKKYPGLKGWAYEPGDLESRGPDLGNVSDLGTLGDLAKKIIKTDTRLVFVGLGALKQEYFIESVRYQVSGIMQEKIKTMTRDTLTHDTPLVLMSVGGSLDIIAGRRPRAPFLLRTIGVEWLWRLFMEPWRWRRQVALSRFLWLILREKLP